MIRISDVRRVSGVKQVVGAAPVNAAVPTKRVSKIKEPFIKEADYSDTSPAAHTVVALLEEAAASGASAVHLEPQGSEVQVRYRVDGLLRSGKGLSRAAFILIVARVKLLANLDVNESRVPQDGRFEVDAAKKRYLVRAAVLPVADGEKIVLHIVDQSAVPGDLEKLGYWGNSLHSLQDAASQSHGLVVVSGPAGSGKTATLYGLLQLVTNPAHSIATVEDTIEHRLVGINQTPVNLKAGMTYANALRAVLHQDPNVVMVGEVREPETSGMVLQAALAGRLVFAGMHTHDVASALAYLESMGAEPYLLASAVKAVANQRLVRRLCTTCREPYKPSAGEFESACTACGLHPGEAISRLGELEKVAAQANGIAMDNKTISSGKVVKLWRANPQGCSACGNTGYKGRVIIAEVLTVSPALQKLIFSTTAPMAIYNQAIAEGMVPLPLDGFVKALLGQTSVEEVLRVVTR